MGVQRMAASVIDYESPELEHQADRLDNRDRRGHGYTIFRGLLSAALVITLLQMLLLWVLKPVELLFGAPLLVDFSFYYIAALSLRLNLHANIYDPRWLPAVAHAYRLFIVKGAGTFNYPLLLPIVLIPLTLLAYPWAARAWYFFNIALWILNTALLVDCLRLGLLGQSTAAAGGARATLRAIKGVTWSDFRTRWRKLSDVSRFTVIFGLFVCLFYAPIIEALNIGQASMLMFTCFMLALWFLRRGQPEWAGVMLTIATLIKIFPAFLLLYFALRRQWRVVAGAIGSLLILLAGMTAVVGLSGVLLMRDIFTAVTTGVFTTFQNVSLERAPMWVAIEMGWRPDNAAAALIGKIMLALVGLVFISVVFVVARWEHADDAHLFHASLSEEEDLTLGFCWALCSMLLISPINWEHYYTWLLPAFLFGLGYTLRHAGPTLRDTTGRWKLEAWVGLLILVALILTFGDLPLGYDGRLTPSLGPYLLGHPLRPFYMLIRPTSGALIWVAFGILFVRHSLRRRRQRAAGTPTARSTEAPSHAAVNARLGVLRAPLNEAVATASSIPWQRLFGVLLAFLLGAIALRIVMPLVVVLAMLR